MAPHGPTGVINIALLLTVCFNYGSPRAADGPVNVQDGQREHSLFYEILESWESNRGYDDEPVAEFSEVQSS